MPGDDLRNGSASPLCGPGSFVREHVANGRTLDVNDFYTFDDQMLGEGRYSQVRAATHKTTGVRRAVKTALRKSKNVPAVVDSGMYCPGRLARHEADILKFVDHPNVIRVYEIFEEPEAIHIVLELCEGGDVLERILVSKGRIPENVISLMFVQILFATWHLHSRGIIHRDLKPEHFLFTRREPQNPNPPSFSPLKVIDFGLSHFSRSDFKPVGGTPQFMPAEALLRNGPVKDYEDRVDIWALGVVLHSMLVGHYPNPHLTDSSQAKYFSKAPWAKTTVSCIDILGLMLRQTPENRPSVATLMQHPWVTSAIDCRGEITDNSVVTLPAAIQRYSSTGGLQHLSLLATAREVDETGFYGLVLIYHKLLTMSNGHLTVEAMQQIAEMNVPLSKVAAAMLQECVISTRRLSGGGKQIAFDWTDILATAVLRVVGVGKKSKAPGGTVDGSASYTGTRKVVEDAVWCAFDVLSLGTGELTSETLCQILRCEAKDSSSKPDQHIGELGDYASAKEVDTLVEELFPKTRIVARSQFMSVLSGEAKPVRRRMPGAFGLFCCRQPPKSHKLVVNEPAEVTSI